MSKGRAAGRPQRPALRPAPRPRPGQSQPVAGHVNAAASPRLPPPGPGRHGEVITADSLFCCCCCFCCCFSSGVRICTVLLIDVLHSATVEKGSKKLQNLKQDVFVEFQNSKCQCFCLLPPTAQIFRTEVGAGGLAPRAPRTPRRQAARALRLVLKGQRGRVSRAQRRQAHLCTTAVPNRFPSCQSSSRLPSRPESHREFPRKSSTPEKGKTFCPSCRRLEVACLDSDDSLDSRAGRRWSPVIW